MPKNRKIVPKPVGRCVERVQIGVRLERGMARALKALARKDQVPLGHLIEDIVNHALWGASTFGGVRTRPPAEREAFKSFLKKAGYSHTAHSPMGFVEKDADAPLDAASRPIPIQRVALGIRMEKNMVKVLKALAVRVDMTLEQSLEDIIAHALEGVSTFPTAKDTNPRAREMHRKIRALMDVYGMTYGVHDHLAFSEKGKG